MDLSYVKADNVKLFEALSSEQALDLRDPQNYVPLYTRLFDLNEGNGRNLNLPHPLRLVTLNEKQGDLHFSAQVEDSNHRTRNASVFFKLSPLLDPLRYITGRYDIHNPHLLSLPGLSDEPCHQKPKDPNNSAYVDSFFSYLASTLLHRHGMLNAIDSYGSFLAVRKGFSVDVADDLDHLGSSDFFAEHEGKLFEFDEAARSRFSRGLGSGKRRSPIKLDELGDVEKPEGENIHGDEDLAELDSIFSTTEQSEAPGLEIVFQAQDSGNHSSKKRRSISQQSSECSSRSSGTGDDDDSRGESSDDVESVSEAGTMSSIGEETFNLVIKEFPVQCIALEKCEATLDALMLRTKLSPSEWESAMFQVIASLMMYGRTFKLTHNDLHTNNIMYVKTDKQHLLYKINGCHYKVPTFGRIFKIIDFGRAIYEYRGRRMCSDSYHKKGDAATQYNCEPYLNSKRPRLEPNPSFDLCRLGCALYDFLMDEYDDPGYRPPAVVEMIIGWCNDDKGRNIMYKSTGEERYPDFKLYKMIARTVHKHTPATALETPCMQRYVVSRSSLGRKAKIMNIDDLPSYTSAPGSI